MRTKFSLFSLCITISLMLIASSCEANVSTTTHSPAESSTFAECESINPNHPEMQAAYKGVYPGRTTEEEVVDILGKPLRTNSINGRTSWEYDNLAISFDGAVVSELYTDGDGDTTLKEIIMQFGCPDQIYMKGVYEEAAGEYSELLFVYHRIGLDFRLDHFPAELGDAPYSLTYFEPGNIDDYKNLFLWLKNPDVAKPITWDEAVK